MNLQVCPSASWLKTFYWSIGRLYHYHLKMKNWLHVLYHLKRFGLVPWIRARITILLHTTMLLHNWFHSNMWLGLALNLPCMNDKGNSCSYSCLIEWVNRSMVKTTRIPVIFITILLYIEQLHCQKSIHLPETDGWVRKNNDWHFYTLLKSMLGYHVIVEFLIRVEKCFIKFWQIVLNDNSR